MRKHVFAGALLLSVQLVPSLAPAQTFTDTTAMSGIAAIVAKNKSDFPDWWVSTGQLADLDGDGDLDFYVGAHGTDGAFVAYNDGLGVFTKTPCSFGNDALENKKTSEFHLAYDIDEDGKLDAMLTYEDGGGQWWLNKTASANAAVSFEPTRETRGGNRKKGHMRALK